jgi:hypothetical protein
MAFYDYTLAAVIVCVGQYVINDWRIDMAHIVANLPAVKCFVRREFLYDFEQGHGELVPCWWISIKSLRGQAFRIEAYLNQYGALYDKLPLHAFCWKPIEGEPLPLDHLQLWDCLSYDITVIKKAQLQSQKCRIKLKTGGWAEGEYLFTVDSAHSDFNTLDTGFAEDVEDHKSYNFVRLNNGQFAAQPNNRMLVLEPSSNPPVLLKPDFRVATRRWSVETDAKWALGATDTVMYETREDSDV